MAIEGVRAALGPDQLGGDLDRAQVNPALASLRLSRLAPAILA
jgi:hypothetical protein